MAAFSAHQLYRSQLRILANTRRISERVERLLKDAGLEVRVRHLAGQLQAGGRPYAQMWFAARQPHKALFTLQAYAMDSDVNLDDPLLLSCERDAKLGALALRRIADDDKLPGVRVLTRLPVLRVNRYHPGQRLLMRLATANSASADMLDLRAAGAVSIVATEFDALAKRLDLHTTLKPQLRSRLCAMAYQRAPGIVLKDALGASNGMHAMTCFATIHAQLGESDLGTTVTQGADTMCWQSIQLLQKLMRAQPGVADLGVGLIGMLTAAHARHPGELLRPSLDVHGIDGWLFDDERLYPLAPTRCIAREPELVAAGVYEALGHWLPACADELFECYQTTLAAHATPLRQPVLRLYRAHRRIAAAVRSSDALDPYGDEAARAHLIEAQRIIS